MDEMFIKMSPTETDKPHVDKVYQLLSHFITEIAMPERIRRVGDLVVFNRKIFFIKNIFYLYINKSLLCYLYV